MIRELQWPPGWPRAKWKKSGSIFDRQDGRPITPDRAEALLRKELNMLGARRVIITGGGCAAAVYFIRDDKPFVIATD